MNIINIIVLVSFLKEGKLVNRKFVKMKYSLFLKIAFKLKYVQY